MLCLCEIRYVAAVAIGWVEDIIQSRVFLSSHKAGFLVMTPGRAGLTQIGAVYSKSTTARIQALGVRKQHPLSREGEEAEAALSNQTTNNKQTS